MGENDFDLGLNSTVLRSRLGHRPSYWGQKEGAYDPARLCPWDLQFYILYVFHLCSLVLYNHIEIKKEKLLLILNKMKVKNKKFNF